MLACGLMSKWYDDGVKVSVWNLPLHTQARLHTRARTHTHARAHTHTRARVHACTRVRMHTHTHSHTHTHTHTDSSCYCVCLCYAPMVFTCPHRRRERRAAPAGPAAQLLLPPQARLPHHGTHGLDERVSWQGPTGLTPVLLWSPPAHTRHGLVFVVGDVRERWPFLVALVAFYCYFWWL